MDLETRRFAAKLHDAARTGAHLKLPLQTDDRVLARVTDGIYRQPASAIRELIANAYDADASHVVVLTDAPRYSEILVRDNGNGMSAEVLVNVIRHIGGSAKRTRDGQESGVTDPNNPRLSPGGRKLIGKIGIGLFSVSQLTRQFTIITKPKNEDFRYTAIVTLHRYTDEDLDEKTSDSKYIAGSTDITTEEVGADEPHGTTISLGDLIPRARSVLQSREMWSGLLNPDPDAGAVRRVEPAVHSGLVGESSDEFEVLPRLPWTAKTPANKRMLSLSDRLIEVAAGNDLYAQLDNAFDYYYRMIWSLGLALPLPYLGEHPFDLPDGTQTRCFVLSNKTRAARGAAGENQATELQTNAAVSAGKAAGLSTPREGRGFRVEIDGLTLFRPIRFDTVPTSSRALQTPLLFVGGYRPDLSKFDPNQRGGGDLEFTGYFYWTPRVVPKEHNGLLVRINGASGTLFDTTFLNYQIEERNRRKQIVAEIFVTKGLEEALNIDRESFNTAHPHYQLLLNWVHNALRQVFNKQKELESEVRADRRRKSGVESRTAVQEARDEELRRVLGEDEDTVNDVLFTDDPKAKAKAERAGKRVYPHQEVIVTPVLGAAARKAPTADARVTLNEERGAALVKLLDAYGLLEHLSPDQQQQFVAAVLRVFNVG
jgi:hypothetical protein